MRIAKADRNISKRRLDYLYKYSKILGRKLKEIRNRKSLSLHEIQEISKGKWKSVVVGSYERGDRAITLERLIDLLNFYNSDFLTILKEVQREYNGGIDHSINHPIGNYSIFNEEDNSAVVNKRENNINIKTLGVDLRKLNELNLKECEILKIFLDAIDQKHEGDVFYLKDDDIKYLGVLYKKNQMDMIYQLHKWGILLLHVETVS